MQQIYTYQNIAWAYVVMARFGEAIKAMQQIPQSDYGYLSRAQLVAAIAHRQAAAGQSAEALETLRLMPALASVQKMWPIVVHLKVDALIAIAKQMQQKDPGKADEILAAAAQTIRGAITDPVLQQMSEGKFSNDRLRTTEELLRGADPKAEARLGVRAAPQVAAWTQTAMEIAAQETPEELLKRLTSGGYDSLHAPSWMAMAGNDLFFTLLKIDVAARRASH